MSSVAIIIPTWNNPSYLQQCVGSIIMNTMTEDLFHIYIVNNGLKEHVEIFKDNPKITVLQQSKNLGWEGGLKAGIQASKEPYVMLMNDDTVILSHQRLWLNSLLEHFVYKEVAAVGPTSNVVMGQQNIFSPLRESVVRAKFLIGFCLLVKRTDLEAAGGIDDTLPGGDDLDLSIRLRMLGKKLLINRDVFVWHHGFKTGTRVHGNEWNSAEMVERTNHALIRKHGLRPFLDLWNPYSTDGSWVGVEDSEGNVVREYVFGKTLEIGCGDQKTVEDSVGIDMVPMGQTIPGLRHHRKSVADIVGDVSAELPVEKGTFDTLIARHVLEHIQNPVKAIGLWGDALKKTGRMIIAVPNQALRNTIPMNWQHVNSYTPESLSALMSVLGWETVEMRDAENTVSFVGVFVRKGLM